MIDTTGTTRTILDAPAERRPSLVRDMWSPMASMMRFTPGADPVRFHRQGFGFDPDGTPEPIRDAARALDDADAAARIERELRSAAADLEAAVPGLRVPDVTAMLVVGDRDDDLFTDTFAGLSGFGGISGSIVLTLWPNPTVLDRLEAIAAHELHHNVRYAPGGVRWDPATVTVGEHIVSEGLADRFASERHGALGPTHFVGERLRTDDELLARVSAGLGTTGMATFGAWVLGDEAARRFGAPPLGLPTGAGYAVGLRLVDAFLDEVGGTAADHIRTPSADIIDVARRRLGLPRPDATTPAVGH